MMLHTNRPKVANVVGLSSLGCLWWQSLHPTLPLLGLRELPSFGAIDDSTALSGRVSPVYSARHGCPALLHGRHQARTAALIMWRTGLRVSEVLELEWRDLDYSSDPATLLVRKSKTRKARTVRLHRDLVQLFTNWPANRTPRDKVVAISMRTVLRHIGDGIEWAGLDEESRGCPFLTAQCGSALADGR